MRNADAYGWVMVMHAQVLTAARTPLQWIERPVRPPTGGELLIAVTACGVCRTDLHVVDGELPHPHLPLVPGHEIVGRVIARGNDAGDFAVGERVGVPWLGWTCGECEFCRRGEENLCAQARFTGYTIDGGYAQQTIADSRYCFRIPARYRDAEAAPLLCAGLIGYRALRMTGDARRIGFYGFGAAAHILAQICVQRGQDVYAFSRPGDAAATRFASDIGAAWSGASDAMPPVELDAAIIFAPVGALVPQALRTIRRGGTVVCAGIHMSDIPGFPYQWLWGERVVRSVANLTRADGVEFFREIDRYPVQTHVRLYDVQDANAALDDLRGGRLQGAAVLTMGPQDGVP